VDDGLGGTVNDDHTLVVTSKGGAVPGNVSYLVSYDPRLLPLIRPKPLRAWVDKIKNPGKVRAKSGRKPGFDFEDLCDDFFAAPERPEFPTSYGRKAAIMLWLSGWLTTRDCPT
jgi:hypothetical protein